MPHINPRWFQITDDMLTAWSAEARDFHVTAAAWVHECDPADVTKAQRQEAKTILFGRRMLLNPQPVTATCSDVQAMLAEFKAKYPELAAYFTHPQDTP